jgi:four helix bundle protein
VKVSRFEDLRAWQKSRELAGAICRATAAGKFARDHGLRDQIQRAAVSIMSNIAEGFGRHSRPEMRQFLAIARASSFEVRSQLYLARDLDYLTEAEHDQLHALCEEVGRLVAALRASLSPERTSEHSAPGT